MKFIINWIAGTMMMVLIFLVIYSLFQYSIGLLFVITFAGMGFAIAKIIEILND